MTHAPMRTCVGCRSIRPQAELLRTRCQRGKVVPALRAPRSTDLTSSSGSMSISQASQPISQSIPTEVSPSVLEGRAVGRAAYLCPSRSCLSQAARRGGFARAFQAGPVTADVDALWAALSNEVNRESNLMQRSGSAAGAMPTARPARVHRLLALAAAMHASGRGA